MTYRDCLNDLSSVIANCATDAVTEPLHKAVILARDSINAGGKLLLFGNGGSAGQAQHIASELVWRLKKDRRGIPAIALTADTQVITAIGNDSTFDRVFSRQIMSIASANKDMAIGFSTSGESPNVQNALTEALHFRLYSCLFTGQNDSAGQLNLREKHVTIAVPSTDTARIQEAHLFLGHMFCQMLEEELGL